MKQDKIEKMTKTGEKNHNCLPRKPRKPSRRFPKPSASKKACNGPAHIGTTAGIAYQLACIWCISAKPLKLSYNFLTCMASHIKTVM